MKYVSYDGMNANDEPFAGVCHKSKIEYLVTPGSIIAIKAISDEDYAKLVDSYGGVETAPAAKAKAKKNAKTEGDSLV